MKTIRLIKPSIEFDDIEKEFREVFSSGIFTRGQYVEDFRKSLSNVTNAKYVHLTTSATTALWTCLKLIGVGQGDEVIVSDFSFPATANVVEDLGARPIFADVSRETYNMQFDDLESLFNIKTKAVIFVDALGNPSGLNQISEICRSKNIPLIEDAACAIGSSENGRACGSIADLTCFSFHPRKLICTGEGGAITTNREEWSRWLDVKLGHGSDGIKGSGLDFVDYGYNFRMSELQAILGNVQIKKISATIETRSNIRREYQRLLEPMGFIPQEINSNAVFNVQSIVFVVPPGISRDRLIAKLKENCIESTIGTYAQSSLTYYSAKYSIFNPNARWLAENTITLPCYQELDVSRVCDTIKNCLAI